LTNEVLLDPHFEKFASPLGHVLLEFNYLEMDVGRLLARLLRQDDVTAAVLGGSLSFSVKTGLIRTLAKLKVQDAEIHNEIMALIKEAKRVNGLRNRYIHAEYMPVLGPNDELLEMLHRRLRDSDKTIDASTGDALRDLLLPVDEDSLRKLAHEINDLALRTRVLAENIADSLP
jgi:hypothetical protein